jgi:hypothetical protein
VKWAFCSDGTLTISGSGEMDNYEPPEGSNSVPWKNYESSITTIVVQEGVTNIGENAFSGCTALSSVSLPNSVTRIGIDAFFICRSLSSITLPSSLTNIGKDAFAGCTGLTSITIPANVTSIGTWAFLSCTGLTSVTNLAVTPQSIESDVFHGLTIGNVSLTVPAGSVALYKAAPVWKDFLSIKGTTTAIETVEKENLAVYPNPVENELFIQSDKPVEKVEIFTASGRVVVSCYSSVINVSHLPKGIYIVRILLAGNQSVVKKIIKK